MTNNFLLITFIAVIILIGIDVAIYFFRRDRILRGYRPFSFLPGVLQKIRILFQDDPKPSKTDIAPNISVSTISSKKISETISAGDSQNPVHVEISADIPQGTSVQFTVEITNSKGKTTTTKRSLAYERQPEIKSIKSAAPIAKTSTEKKARGNSKSSQKAGDTDQVVDDRPQRGWARALYWGRQPQNLGTILLAASIVIYALVISIGIDRFPIYFFTDEAIHMNLASDFIRDGFRNYDKEFLPTFFIAEGWVNGTSVYVQILPYLLFGKSIVVTRLVSAFITLLAALSLGLLLKQVFKIKYHWAGVFLLLTTPAWFLHARTAFEYAEVASFYMLFLYFYSRYRDGHLRSLYAAIFAGALAFYTHGLGQILMTITGLALFITDFRYHIHPNQRKTVLISLVLGLILLLPFVRYYLAHVTESASQIKRRGSYWFNDELTTPQKFYEFLSQYFYGLNPLYWYFNNSVDLSRHIMKGLGNGLLITLPFALLGFIKVITNLRQPAYRIALIAFLAAPLPASIVAIGMPRMLWMSIPLAIITALGLSWFLENVEAYWKKISTWLPGLAFTLLMFLSVFMLRNALVNGPIWFDDYGLYGMQYGAKQIFAETIVPELEQNPNLTFYVSPSWANGTDKFASFFIPEKLSAQVQFGQPTDLIINPSKLSSPNVRFIVPYNEYDNLIQNPKFKDIVVHKIIPYPNGKPGFYILNLSAADNLDELLAAERIKNITPVEDSVEIKGQQVRVVHSPFDSGGLIHIFDHNPDTLARVMEANPFTFDLYPTTPLDTHSVVIQTATLPDFTVTISLYASETAAPQIYAKTFKNLEPDPIVTMTFDNGPSKSARIYIEIKDNLSGEKSQIHVRQIEFK